MPTLTKEQTERSKSGKTTIPVDKDKIERNIQESFDKAFSKVTDKDLVKPEIVEETKEEKEPEREQKEKETDSDAEEVTEQEQHKEKAERKETPVKKEKKEAAADEAPTLPDSHRRSLKASEWTDEEIDEALKENPSAFLKQAAKVHEKRNKEIQKFAELGRKNRAPIKSQVSEEKPKPAPQPADSEINEEALRKQYPGEPIVEVVAKLLARDRDRQAQVEAAKQEHLGQIIDVFFGSNKNLHERFGESTRKATQDHLAERQKVLEHADAIVGGYMAQGRSITVEDALQMAVDALTSDDKKETARKEIQDKVRERSKSVTVRPSTRSAPAPTPDPKNALEAKVAEGFKKVFRRA